MLNTKNIERAMEERKISKAKLCSSTKIARTTLDAILNGSDAKVSTIETLAFHLGVPVAYFFDEEPTGVRIEGDGNQLNGAGAHGNLNGISDSVMAERVRSLEAIVAEKDERIAELKQHIADLKSQN